MADISDVTSRLDHQNLRTAFKLLFDDMIVETPVGIIAEDPDPITDYTAVGNMSDPVTKAQTSSPVSTRVAILPLW